MVVLNQSGVSLECESSRGSRACTNLSVIDHNAPYNPILTHVAVYTPTAALHELQSARSHRKYHRTRYCSHAIPSDDQVTPIVTVLYYVPTTVCVRTRIRVRISLLHYVFSTSSTQSAERDVPHLACSRIILSAQATRSLQIGPRPLLSTGKTAASNLRHGRSRPVSTRPLEQSSSWTVRLQTA